MVNTCKKSSAGPRNSYRGREVTNKNSYRSLKWIGACSESLIAIAIGGRGHNPLLFCAIPRFRITDEEEIADTTFFSRSGTWTDSY